MRQLIVKNLSVCKRRLILQRHINDGGKASHAGRGCTVRIIFPPVVAGIIQMGVTVNSSRENIVALSINRFVCLNISTRFNDGCDLACLDTYTCCKNSVCCYYLAIFNNQIKHSYKTPTKAFTPCAKSRGSVYSNGE